MTAVIYKYPLPIEDRAKVTLPLGARVIHIGDQGDLRNIVVWAIVDPNEERTVQHEYRIFGTGHPFPDDEDLSHRETIIARSGLVWHVFQDVPF